MLWSCSSSSPFEVSRKCWRKSGSGTQVSPLWRFQVIYCGRLMNVGLSSVEEYGKRYVGQATAKCEEGVPVPFNEEKATVLNQTRRIVKVRWTLFMALEKSKRRGRRSSDRIMICRGWLGMEALPQDWSIFGSYGRHLLSTSLCTLIRSI